MENYKEELQSLKTELNSRIDAVISKIEKPKVEEALTKEIYKKIPINTYFTCLETGSKQILNSLDFDHFYNHNTIYNQKGYQVFKDGIFATPIKTKTIEEISKDLSILSEHGIKEYLIKEKTVLIETLNNL